MSNVRPFRRKPKLRSQKDPADILTCSITGRRVWVREVWNDGGAAHEIVKVDHQYTCPVCMGSGQIEFLKPARHSAQVDQDTRMETCTACNGSGTVEALYGYNPEPGQVIVDPQTDAVEVVYPEEEYMLLWPVDEDDAIIGVNV